jgi:two-component system phosphate regulon sensor histidine kinase PhoR
LVGVGSAEQRWELRIQQVTDDLKLFILTDHSSRYAADRMRTDFVANASHELRTPIAAIKGFVETLQDPQAGNDKDTRARFLKIMFDEANRMQRLIEDLMSLSRIEAARYQLPEEPVDLRNLIAEVQDFFISSRNQKDQDFLISLPTDMQRVKGDRVQLSQLLSNLISNAFKYGHKGAPVSITAAPNKSGSMIRLSIKNRGDGIEAKHIPRLTERFYRVDKGRSKAIGGTGLGLAIVKHITERHGGRMEISSEQDVGTTVAILLPVIK